MGTAGQRVGVSTSTTRTAKGIPGTSWQKSVAGHNVNARTEPTPGTSVGKAIPGNGIQKNEAVAGTSVGKAAPIPGGGMGI